MIQKNNFNSEYEREKNLKFFGESLIFFGSILNLIWIIEENGIKMKFKKSKNTWTIRSPSLIEVANLMIQNAHSTYT